MSASNSEFSHLRAFFWPIHRHELKKVLPMMLILFLIYFNYSVLRNVKDTVVVTAKYSGAEVLPFIKVWVLLPMAIFVTLLFTKLSARYGREKVFHLMVSGFLIFYGLFTFVFYPLQDILHPHQFANYLETILPTGFKGLIAMCRNWTLTIFYVMCELWGSAIGTVMFWGFVNEVTKLSEARRFYSILGLTTSLSGIVAGVAANFLSSGLDWDQTLQVLVTAVIICGCLIMGIFHWMSKNVPDETAENESDKEKKVRKKKNRLSLRESFTYLSNSKYLICIACIVVSYNLVINLIEIVWKDQLRQVYSSPLEYNSYMNTMSSVVGIFATLTSLFMSQLMARFGWTRTALITPVIMLITSLGFFAFMLFRNDLHEPVFLLTGTTPLVIAVFFGAAQVCMSKACKYSVFDATKEMAFIPLDHDSRLKGKAAIDGVGSRLGKSGGSFIHQGLLMFLTTVSASAPYVAVTVMIVIGGWIFAVRSLGRQFGALVDDQEGEAQKASPPKDVPSSDETVPGGEGNLRLA
jgi:AAA family ATP:ADP antiporter